MKSIVTVERLSQDGLELTRWEFYYLTGYRDTGIVLEGYTELSKPTPRHKFRVDRQYKRLMPRDNTVGRPAEIPLDVQIEAMNEFRKSLRWME